AIVPGDVKRSTLVQRLTSRDPDELMPPPEEGKPLNSGQVESLIRWVKEGAKWKNHWSFIPPERPVLPKVREQDWPRDEIDYFILEQLEKKGLKPAPEADKATLIRRASFDLTGLPPTIGEVDAFLADDSPEAYEKLVDRLLSSVNYGERMAANWLDLARYADTSGYHFDGLRFMWLWRDWVIDAFNENKPYDTFTVEQLAGDLLPEPTREQRIATGFVRNNELGGTQEKWERETNSRPPPKPSDEGLLALLRFDDTIRPSTKSTATEQASPETKAESKQLIVEDASVHGPKFVRDDKPEYADGRLGKALRFDGKTHIHLGQLVAFERTYAFSYG